MIEGISAVKTPHMLIITSHRELELAFKTESMTVWYFQYDEPAYIEATLLKVWLYTEKNPDRRPTDKVRWKKLIDKFLEGDFEQWKKQLQFKKIQGEKAKHRFDTEPPPHDDENIRCHFCKDLGYIWVYAHDGSHDGLMRDKCTLYDRAYENDEIPAWDDDLLHTYRREPVPKECFPKEAPVGVLFDGDGRPSFTFHRTMMDWMSLKKGYSVFWKQRGWESKKLTEKP